MCSREAFSSKYESAQSQGGANIRHAASLLNTVVWVKSLYCDFTRSVWVIVFAHNHTFLRMKSTNYFQTFAEFCSWGKCWKACSLLTEKLSVGCSLTLAMALSHVYAVSCSNPASSTTLSMGQDPEPNPAATSLSNITLSLSLPGRSMNCSTISLLLNNADTSQF